MKLFFFILSLLYFTHSADPSRPSASSVYIGSQSVCPSYVCQNSAVKTGCATYSGTQMQLEGCLGDWYCDWDSSPSSSTPYQFGKCLPRQKHSKFRKGINDFCYQDSDCKTSYCVLNRCNVKTSGAACTSSYQCGKGMTCDPVSDTCQNWLPDGSDCTSKPSLCKPSSACASIDGANAVCTALFSLSTQTVSRVYSGFLTSTYDYLCSSGSRSSTGACSSSSYSLAGGYPKTCNDYRDCAANGDGNMYMSCNCWPNTEGVKYCKPFPGDYIDTFNRAKARYTRDFSTCYNYQIGYAEGDCGLYDLNADRNWAPQIKAGTWGSCFDSVHLKVMGSVGTYNGNCAALKCNTGNNEDGDCFHYAQTSHMYYLQGCPSNYICGSKYDGNYYLSTNDVACVYGRHRDRKAHKGESCWADADCFSGICDITKVCTVYSLGASCDYSNQCDRGMFCGSTSTSSSKTCQQWIDIGGACTTETYGKCRTGLYCIASGAGQTSGTCQAMYSAPAGSSIYRISSGGSYQTGSDSYCQSGAYDSTTQTCFSSSHKLSSYPQTCTYSTDCKSTNYKEGSYDYSSCSCFPNTQGQKYCQVYPANIDSNYYSFVNNYYSRDLSNCFYYELGSNYGGSCGTSYYFDYWANSIPGQYFPSCGRDVLYDEDRYEDNQEDNLIYVYSFSSRLFAAVSFLLALLLLK